MLDLAVTNQMKKDLKLSKKRGKNLSKINSIIELLRQGYLLPPKYRNHRLSGNYKDHWECHIEGDWLLIYILDSKTLTLVRTGTHADFFE